VLLRNAEKRSSPGSDFSQMFAAGGEKGEGRNARNKAFGAEEAHAALSDVLDSPGTLLDDLKGAIMLSVRSRQLELAFPARWGGARQGAGRKRAERGSVSHRARPLQRAGEPVHVTLRARLAPLRSQHVFPTVRLALARAARRDPTRFRLLHFSVQRDHLHLIVEAADKRALSSGVRSVAIRVARYVNELLSRRGPLWADRWHGRALRTPREVRNALVYVLMNFRKHTRDARVSGIDPFSSGAWFDGWRGWRASSGIAPPFAEAAGWLRRADAGSPVGAPRTWLARTGWRRHGLLKLDEAPRAATDRSRFR
jgi:REP element-mobilizing transposase RayT